MSHEFNPNSTDAMFAQILTRMDAQDQMLANIKASVDKTNGRVTALERDKWYQRGVMAAVGVSASAAWEFITKK